MREDLYSGTTIVNAMIYDNCPDNPKTVFNGCTFTAVDLRKAELFQNSFTDCTFMNCIGVPKQNVMRFADCQLIESPELAEHIIKNDIGNNCDLGELPTSIA